MVLVRRDEDVLCAPLEPSPPGSFKRLLGGNNVLALDEAAGVVARGDVFKRDVALYCAEEWDPATDEDGNARDYQAVNEPGVKKPLNSWMYWNA